MSVDVGAEGKQPPRLTCPEGWVLTELKAVAHVALGKTPGKDDYLSSGKYKIVKYRDLGNDRRIDWGKCEKGFVDGSRAAKLNLRELKEGDVVISASAHSSEIIGRKVLFVDRLPDDFDVVYYVGEILSIRTDADISPDLGRLFNYFFQSLNGYKSIQSKVHGVHLIASRAAEMIVPVPPKEAQKRIVSKIDELFSRIDEGERALERVQKLVERYRQSVLKAAVTGELTRNWREKQAKSGAPIETSEALLARILTARREAWEQTELDKMRAKGIKPKDDKWKQKYAEPGVAKLGIDDSIPDGWAQPSLEQATRADRPIAYGVLQPGEDAPHGISMVRVCDVANGVVNQDELKRIAQSISNQFPRTLLQGGEVLLTLVGTIGRTAIVPKELAGANVARAVGVLTPVSVVLPQWLELCLRGQKARQLLTDNAREVARKTLNLEQLREFAVPIPCIGEQEEAISRVEEMLSRANATLDAIKQQMRFSSALRQATLKSAFSGLLVDQDATDEPAVAFLERIATERAAAPAKPKRSPKIKKKSTK